MADKFISIITSNTTISLGDDTFIINVSADTTVTLPDMSGMGYGTELEFTRKDTNDDKIVTLSPTSTTIDGASSYSILINQTIKIVYKDDEWKIIANSGTVNTVMSALLNGLGVATGVTDFASFFGTGLTLTEANVQLLMPVSGILSNLYVSTSTTQSASGNMVITLRKNGSDTSVTITIAAGSGAGTFKDDTHSFSFAAGDKLSVKFTNNALILSALITSFSVRING